MLKKTPLILTFILFLTVGMTKGQARVFHAVSDSEITSRYVNLSVKQLFDTAKRYYFENSLDEALACFDLLMNKISQHASLENQKMLNEIYFFYAASLYEKEDYYMAYRLLLESLKLSEANNDKTQIIRVYTLIGNIYHRFGEQDLARKYFSKGLDYYRDSSDLALLFNNLGYASVKAGDLDCAFHYLSQSLQIAERHNRATLHIISGSMAKYYHKKKMYDSARQCYHLAIDLAKNIDSDPHHKYLSLSASLSGLGKLFFEINQLDSAVFYANLSNAVAIEHSIPLISVDNYLLLSQIAESRGRQSDALKYYKQYADLKDQIFGRENINKINQLRHSYEVSNRDRKIEQYAIEQQIKEQVIRYQRTNQYILSTALILISIFLAFMVIQNKKLNTAYKNLFEKNLQITEIQSEIPEEYSRKYKKSALTDNMQAELLDKILAQMENTSIICDTEFSVNRLADLVHSNSTYVSQVINTVFGKNFRSFLNEYKIKEAQRLFSAPDGSKYTIEAVALQVGFKSRTAFRDTFKEITGVTPNFYLKSLRSLHGS